MTPLSPAMAESMTRIVRENPWKVFCRGIFIRGEQLPDDEIDNLFRQAQPDSDLSLGVFEGTRMKGFAVARPCETRLEVFLLEVVRDANHAETTEALLAEMLVRAENRSIKELSIRPHPILSSGFNLKDDAMLDVLAKMGYWQDITIAAEMRIDLKGYQVPQKVQDRETQFAEQGFAIRPCCSADLDGLDTMCDWRQGTGNSWGKLLRDVITEVDPKFIILAVNNDLVVGYSTFFARTILSELPEYGPVFVKKELRSKGVASVMLSKSLMQIVQLGQARQVQLSCYPNKFPVYPRQGFFFTDKYLFHATSRPTAI